jgi:acyl carrier protein
MREEMGARERIRSFVVDTFFVDGFGDDEPFLRAGIVDSMGMLQLVTFLQEAFEIEIQEEELVPENLDSLARATAFVKRKLEARSAA